ncbi:sensor histidine kinase [Enterococcus alishanensis]
MIRKNMYFMKQLLKENAGVIWLYILVVVLFASTFFLYDIPTNVYQDAIIFTFPLLIIFLIIRGIKLTRKHQKLQHLLQEPILNDWHKQEEEFLTILESDYQEIITKVTRQTRDMQEQQEKQEKELMDYYSLWTHQIKTPLAALDLMIQTFDQPQKNAMQEETFKIQQYLEMMLQYLRMQSIQQDFRFEVISIEKVVKNVVKKYARFFIHKDLEVDLTQLTGEIITDEKWFSFILEQIIFNAIKYTQIGKITIYTPVDRLQEIVIKDTGQGILAEDIPRVFQRGFTGYTGRQNQKASGLGLFMSQEIAQELGLNLRLTSKVGVGTEVTIDSSKLQTFSLE